MIEKKRKLALITPCSNTSGTNASTISFYESSTNNKATKASEVTYLEPFPDLGDGLELSSKQKLAVKRLKNIVEKLCNKSSHGKVERWVMKPRKVIPISELTAKQRKKYPDGKPVLEHELAHWYICSKCAARRGGKLKTLLEPKFMAPKTALCPYGGEKTVVWPIISFTWGDRDFIKTP